MAIESNACVRAHTLATEGRENHNAYIQCACACACVRVCARVCVRACVCACTDVRRDANNCDVWSNVASFLAGDLVLILRVVKPIAWEQVVHHLVFMVSATLSPSFASLIRALSRMRARALSRAFSLSWRLIYVSTNVHAFEWWISRPSRQLIAGRSGGACRTGCCALGNSLPFSWIFAG